MTDDQCPDVWPDDMPDPGPEPTPPPLIADPAEVVALVGDLGDNLSSVSPDREDFLVDRAWAEALIAAVHGWEPETDGTLADQARMRGVSMDTYGAPGTSVRVVIDGREPSDHGTDDEWPAYPCPDDPDGLHHVGCGCEF